MYNLPVKCENNDNMYGNYINYHTSIMMQLILSIMRRCRLAPVLKTIFPQCVISYTCSQSNSDGYVLNNFSSMCHIIYL